MIRARNCTDPTIAPASATPLWPNEADRPSGASLPEPEVDLRRLKQAPCQLASQPESGVLSNL